jgi:hypothetical protein
MAQAVLSAPVTWPEDYAGPRRETLQGLISYLESVHGLRILTTETTT